MTPKTSCIILDDEPLAYTLLADYANSTDIFHVLYAGSDVYKAIEILRQHKVDLIFIDIQMPELTGIEFMELFKEHHFVITSAYQEYALDAFRFQVVDYLVKPITPQRFHQSIERYTTWKSSFRTGDEVDYLIVKADRKHHKITFDRIVYIEGLKDYIRIHTDDENILALENMKDIIERLPKHKFLRIHRSYIVPVGRIKMVDGNKIQMQNMDFVPIGETYRKPVLTWLENNT